MIPSDALYIIDSLKNFALDKHIGLLIVGSVGYRSALYNTCMFELCDDIDCIFIYENISTLAECPYLDEKFYTMATHMLGNTCDLFATKKIIRGIQVSIDFISADYLRQLATEPIDGQDKFRRKLTDSFESKQHIYSDHHGNRIYFEKSYIQCQTYRVYSLPIHLFKNGAFYPGVLLGKYLYNPVTAASIKGQNAILLQIQKNVAKVCPKDGDMCNSYYKNSNFSDETRTFLRTLQAKYSIN